MGCKAGVDDADFEDFSSFCDVTGLLVDFVFDGTGMRLRLDLSELLDLLLLEPLPSDDSNLLGLSVEISFKDELLLPDTKSSPCCSSSKLSDLLDL